MNDEPKTPWLAYEFSDEDGEELKYVREMARQKAEAIHEFKIAAKHFAHSKMWEKWSEDFPDPPPEPETSRGAKLRGRPSLDDS